MWLLHIDSWQEFVIGILVRVFIIMCIMPVHEFAHGWMANKLGDPTARFNGRLTLNPIAHIDLLGAVLIIFAGFGWAKPVPVNPYNFSSKSRKRDMALTALAGPVSNLLFALIGMILLRVIACFDMGTAYNAQMYITYGFYFLVSINISLAVFNLIPIYPLDGSRILGGILPDGFNEFMEKNGRVISMIFIALIFFGLLDNVLSFLVSGVTHGLFAVVNGLFNLIGLDSKGIFETLFTYFGLTA